MINSIHINDSVADAVNNSHFISGYLNIFKTILQNADDTLLHQQRILSRQLHGINPLF